MTSYITYCIIDFSPLIGILILNLMASKVRKLKGDRVMFCQCFGLSLPDNLEIAFLIENSVAQENLDPWF